ncbi:unnamed protein product [Paramecium octaurelia]|uniref:GATOR2 complex protein MIO zinc-ribbon like domain-containing protein n=1 Tax=Paramecium octaurelia TaxID=43137 RepID=A0A8S1SIP5_PAROT|nr:unnamed protein product [Paramecium octaurelia]
MIKNPKSEGDFRLQQYSASNSCTTIPDRINQTNIQESIPEESYPQAQQQEITYTFYNVRQILQKEYGLNIELPYQQLFTQQEFDLLLEKYKPDQPIEKFDESNGNKEQKLVDLFMDRLKKKFYFDASDIVNIEFSDDDPMKIYIDIFKYLVKQKDKQYNRSSINSDIRIQFESKEQPKEQSDSCQMWHRKVYYNKYRKNQLKLNGFNLVYDYHEKLVEPLIINQQRSTNYIRNVAILVCTFQFTKITDFAKLDQDIIPILKVAINIQSDISKDRSDCKNFYSSDNNLSQINQISSQNYEKINRSNNFAKSGTSQISNILETPLRQAYYKQNLQQIQQMCKDIKHTDPYMQLILNFIGMDDKQFQEYLLKDDNRLHFEDRMILTLLYCDDKLLNEFSLKKKPLDQIINYGALDKRSVDCLRLYLEETRDIQLVGILSAHLYLLENKDIQLLTWFQEYRNFLNSKQLYKERMIIENQIKDFQNKNPPLLIEDLLLSKQQQIVQYCQCNSIANPECLSCLTLYPKCSICYNPIQNQLYVVCLICRHGGHEKHIQEWFNIYDQCPYKKCQCYCKYE